MQKESELQVLKEMVKSVKHQLAAREHDLTKLLKKVMKYEKRQKDREQLNLQNQQQEMSLDNINPLYSKEPENYYGTVSDLKPLTPAMPNSKAPPMLPPVAPGSI